MEDIIVEKIKNNIEKLDKSYTIVQNFFARFFDIFLSTSFIIARFAIIITIQAYIMQVSAA